MHEPAVRLQLGGLSPPDAPTVTGGGSSRSVCCCCCFNGSSFKTDYLTEDGREGRRTQGKQSLRTADTTGLKDDMVNGTSDVTEGKTIQG